MNDKDTKRSPLPTQYYAVPQPYPGENEISLVDLLLVLRKKWRMLLVSFLVLLVLSTLALFHIASKKEYSRLLKLPTYNTLGSDQAVQIVDTKVILARFNSTVLPQWMQQKIPLADTLKVSLLTSNNKDQVAENLLQMQVKSRSLTQANAILDKVQVIIQPEIKASYNKWLLAQQTVLAQKNQQLKMIDRQMQALTASTANTSAASESQGSLIAALMSQKTDMQSQILSLQWQMKYVQAPLSKPFLVSEIYKGLPWVVNIVLALLIAAILSTLFVFFYYGMTSLRQQMRTRMQQEYTEKDTTLAAG